ncbi:hypothetical protein NL54_01880 [Pantoea stewartii]|uniref:Transposase n=1 Tax=Pantoea stewartii TaxID=66269 RepID=A0AB34VFS0_9GAMM|nr:hypothetical protein NL54_01880 [Pantoea stewartii]KHN61952.1 hypothetical protein OI73_13940 [Pantoea stewartii]KTS74769.1 hypothetical protein RSA30_05690 [Pantoea stewartii]KTS98022.1 hypothetical protein RSA13_10420 [Pantoea stewartii]KTT06738.1 hypothetical protein RSA36_15385 [Pantoea stewartii]
MSQTAALMGQATNACKHGGRAFFILTRHRSALHRWFNDRRISLLCFGHVFLNTLASVIPG